MFNVVSILDRAYVNKTNDINMVNRARSHTDSEVEIPRGIQIYPTDKVNFFVISSPGLMTK